MTDRSAVVSGLKPDRSPAGSDSAPPPERLSHGRVTREAVDARLRHAILVLALAAHSGQPGDLRAAIDHLVDEIMAMIGEAAA